MKQAKVTSIRFLPREGAAAPEATPSARPPRPQPRGPRGPSRLAQAVMALVLLSMLIGPML